MQARKTHTTRDGHIGRSKSPSAFHHDPGREPVVKDVWREQTVAV